MVGSAVTKLKKKLGLRLLNRVTDHLCLTGIGSSFAVQVNRADKDGVVELLLRPDEVESSRHAGEGRHPVSESNRRLDPGLRPEVYPQLGDGVIHFVERCGT